MTEMTAHPERLADRRADRRALLIILIFTTASFFVEAMSDQFDMAQAGYVAPQIAWVSQATSHAVIIALAPAVGFTVSRFPLSTQRWHRNLPAHLLAAVIFSLVHILAMVGLRKLLTPIFFGFNYDFGLADPSIWIYEFRKDALTYAMTAAIFMISRLVEQKILEAEAARKEATERHRLTLRSGGRTFLVDTADVIFAKAASNYVEVVTPGRTYLARSTLAELEKLLAAADGRHIRVHRSFLVHSHHISEIIPTGDGNVTIRLDTGVEIPGSRGFRDRLPAATSQSGETLS